MDCIGVKLRNRKENRLERKIVKGAITPAFCDMLLGLPEPSDKEIENKLTPFFSIFLDNGFSSEHYGTKLNDGYEWNHGSP